jgi:hypothetical protein
MIGQEVLMPARKPDAQPDGPPPEEDIELELAVELGNTDTYIDGDPAKHLEVNLRSMMSDAPHEIDLDYLEKYARDVAEFLVRPADLPEDLAAREVRFRALVASARSYLEALDTFRYQDFYDDAVDGDEEE